MSASCPSKLGLLGCRKAGQKSGFRSDSHEHCSAKVMKACCCEGTLASVSLPWKPPKSKRALSKAHLSSHEKPPFADTAFNFRISCSPDVNSMKSLNKSSPEERQSRVQARNSSLDYQTRQVGNLMATSVTTVAPNLQPMGLSWGHFAAWKIYLIISASNAIETEKVAHINCYQWYSYCFYVHL